MTKSETISREENIRCRLCICEAVEYLREGLRPFVEMRLQLAYGSNWIPKVNDRIDEENKKKGTKNERISRLRVSTNGKKVQWDSRSLLKAIHLTFKDAFQEEFECTQYQVTCLRKQLNSFSHEKSFDFKGTELTLKGMEYILKAAKSLEQAKLVEGVRRRLVDESPAVLSPIDKPRSPMNPTADKPENGGGKEVVSIETRRTIHGGNMIPHIEHEQKYRQYMEKTGVGKKDVVASSPDAYVSYLNSVSRLLGNPVTPNLLRTENKVDQIKRALEGLRAPKTITNYGSAMHKYRKMVEVLGL